MITVEDLLMAYASAYDAWLDPEVERKNPTPEYAELIRQAISFENAKLREELEAVGTAAYLYGRDDLKAENAKLREQVERLHADQAHWELGNCPSCPNVADLQEALEQNAKLRELVRGMYKAFMHGNCYRWCEFKEPCNYILDGKCQWYDRARELGIEVNA